MVPEKSRVVLPSVKVKGWESWTRGRGSVGKVWSGARGKTRGQGQLICSSLKPILHVKSSYQRNAMQQYARQPTTQAIHPDVSVRPILFSGRLQLRL